MTREEIRAKFFDIRKRAMARGHNVKNAETIARIKIGDKLVEGGMKNFEAVYEIYKSTRKEGIEPDA